MFELHPQLRQDCVALGRFDLSLLLLMRDANYPWCILVPERPGITEIYQLAPGDRQRLMDESVLLAETMAGLFAADKMNVAALGNVVPQLHLHHIARRRDDPAWPAPVWGRVPAQPYDGSALETRIARLRSTLGHALHPLQ